MKQIFTLSFLMLFLFHPDTRADWTIVASYPIPGKASGLATDGTMLYFGIYGADGSNIYMFNPSSGTASLLFNNPQIGDSYGMTCHEGSLWILDRENSSTAYALELSMSGQILSQIDLQDTYMSGIAAKSNGFWVSTYYPEPGTVYEIDFDGNVVSQFTPPNDQVWDVCLEGDDLWLADYNANMLYKTTSVGNLIESHACENQKPSGIVFDGTFLWYVDGPLGGTSTLYKIDLSGAGTPAINVPVTTHQFNNTTISESDIWMVQINNTGTADLTIEDISISANLPVITDASFPLTLAPGDNTTVNLIFAPMEHGFFEGTAQIISNDPLHPLVLLQLSGHGLANGPYLTVDHSTVNYGEIRTGASKVQVVQFQNYGNENLSIESMTIVDNAFYFELNDGMPVNLPPLATINLLVWFFPSSGGEHIGVLSIENNGSVTPANISLTGNALTGTFETGAQLWTYQIPPASDVSPKAMHRIKDITGDGKADVVVCSEDNLVRLLNGNASGTSQQLWEHEIYSGSVYQQDALSTITDINQDGYEDIIVGTAWGDRSIVALSGNTGEQIWKHSTANYGGGGWVYQVDASADYNGDGMHDVLAASGNNQDNNGPRRAYCLDGLNGNVIWEAFLGGAGFAVKSIADINADGIPDALAGCSDPGETQGFVKAINGSNGSTFWTFTTSGTSVWALAQVDDINSDGVKDVMAGSFDGHLYLLDAVTGNILAQGSAGNNIILRLIPMGDLNNDGFTDVAIAYSGTFLTVYDGVTCDQLYIQSLPDKVWNVERIPDISGDGLDDLATGTLYQSNYAGFYDGSSGLELFSTPFGQAIDALTVLPDITGDYSWEMIAGGRNGKIVCYSGGLNSPVETNKQDLVIPKVTISPNPASQNVRLSVNLTESSTVGLKLYNAQGMLVWQKDQNRFSAGHHEIALVLPAFPEGIYLMEVQFTRGKQNLKLILTK